ncbi:uncharacterized protein BP5553_04670 [Venustampulla echinocandica]|uniref:Glyoxalase-like domain-containing protein n=1 Tax=Venustampulla echinocandica TaxID=2656787 RepID=A0A370TNY3_9HELO|nr:uncharacterized protein BP5553_04670 [Venustampulla echinocandica]RDL37237.1 hypothetical protein BP5553_04670 [Venustampulla echinocandica]
MATHLDHVIILVSPSTLSSLPPFLTENFTITPGGRHVDNLTENKLICFRDGSYIELIAFITPSEEERAKHWWGKKKEGGIIDFAFTTKATTGEDVSKHHKDLQARLLDSGSKAGYELPRPGGRKRESDGQDIKWHVTFPAVGSSSSASSYQRGLLPFFCHDVTPRSLRAPVAEENVTHPCGAEGIKGLTAYVTEERVVELTKDYGVILDVDDLADGLESLYGGKGGAREPVKISVKAPKKGEEALRSEIEDRGGLVLGDLVFWGHSRKAGDDGLRRIDVGDGNISLGGLFLDLSAPDDI